jgi:hypothetical protein
MTINAHLRGRNPHLRAQQLSCLGVITLFYMVLWVGPASAQALMSAEEIRTSIIGQRIFLATPLGGEIPLNYRPDGQVDGSGEAVGLGRFFQPKDKGRWWIAGNQLCQKWETWYKGERICFTLERKGETSFIWRRDNGESGTARRASR